MTNLSDLQARGLNGIAFEPAALVQELAAYGETEAAERMKTIDLARQADISTRALTILLRESCIVDKAVCLAAVEVFFGESRPLRRKRRIYQKA